jgi:hypothetical protein
MFKGQTFPTKRTLSEGNGIDSDCWDGDDSQPALSIPI